MSLYQAHYFDSFFESWHSKIHDLQKISHNEQLLEGGSAAIVLGWSYIEALGAFLFYDKDKAHR